MKKLLILLVTIVVTSFSVSISAEEKPQLTSAEQEMINLSRQKWQWMAEKNADKLAEIFHDQAQFVHMGGYWGKE